MLLPLELLLIGRCVTLVVETRLLTLLVHLALICLHNMVLRVARLALSERHRWLKNVVTLLD